MSGKLIGGVLAAVGTPRDAKGRLDEAGFCHSLEHLMQKGIEGFAINGATGEYCLTSPEELARLVALAAGIVKGRADLICGIGSAGIHGFLNLGGIAVQAGAKALLLPMPHFFPYAQTDLEAFSRTLVENLDAPILLYNLPFNSPLEPHTVGRLPEDCQNIVGIKDGSGSLEILSGVATVLPELILSLNAATPNTNPFTEAARVLSEYIQAISLFPVPWGLKFTGEFLGIGPASFSQPVSPERRAQAEAPRDWLFTRQEASEKVA